MEVGGGTSLAGAVGWLNSDERPSETPLSMLARLEEITPSLLNVPQRLAVAVGWPSTKYSEKHPTYLVCPRADDSKSSKNLQSTTNIGKQIIYKSTHLSCYLSTIYNVLRPKKLSQSTSFSAMSSTFYKPKIGQIYNLQLGLTSPSDTTRIQIDQNQSKM